MSDDAINVMPILHNDEKWYVCSLGEHHGHEAVEVVNKATCEQAVLTGEVGDAFMEQFSEAAIGGGASTMSEFMSSYQGLMRPCRSQ